MADADEKPPSRAEIFERAALALEHSAMLADEHAERHEEAGRAEQAARERRNAAGARKAAAQARALADSYRV